MAIYQTRCCSRRPAEVFVLGPSLQLQWLSRPAPGQPPRPSQPITIIVNPPPGAVQTTRINCRHDVWKRVVSPRHIFSLHIPCFYNLCIHHKKCKKKQSLFKCNCVLSRNHHKLIRGSNMCPFYLYLHTRVEEGRLPAAEFSSLVLMVDQSLTSLTLVAGNCAEAGLEAGAEAGLPRTGRMGGR